VLRRPTHRNTSWDVARFEVPAQKWADLSEFGSGVAVLNDCKYGYSIEGGEILLSLLKAPKAPDETCDVEDRSHHVFTYSLLPHLGSLQEGDVIGEANRLNSPLISAFLASNSPSPSLSDSFISILGTKNKNIVIEAVKRAQKKENAVVLRLYEAFGGSTHEVVRLKLNLGRRKVVAAEKTNLLEDKEEELRVSPTDGTIEVGFLRAFEIVTILAVLE
jgi:alpha-mannosidase